MNFQIDVGISKFFVAHCSLFLKF